jgi:hypothetical protein
MKDPASNVTPNLMPSVPVPEAGSAESCSRLGALESD